MRTNTTFFNFQELFSGTWIFFLCSIGLLFHRYIILFTLRLLIRTFWNSPLFISSEFLFSTSHCHDFKSTGRVFNNVSKIPRVWFHGLWWAPLGLFAHFWTRYCVGRCRFHSWVGVDQCSSSSARQRALSELKVREKPAFKEAEEPVTRKRAKGYWMAKK